MKKIKQILEYISTLDFLTILVTIFSLSLWTTAGGTLLNPERFGEFYRTCLACSVVSFTVSYLILKPIEYFYLSKLPVNLTWLLIIILGSSGFTYLLFKLFIGKDLGLPDFSIFVAFIFLGLIPATIFRFTTNFAISFWQERKEEPISIVN